MANMLIAGRGWPGVAAAILARSRGHEVRLIYDDSPSVGTILGGLSGAPLSGWFSKLGFSFADDLFQRVTPSLLFMGERWDLLGVFDLLEKACDVERKRFAHGLSIPDDPVFEQIRKHLSESFARVEGAHSFSGKMLEWFLSPFFFSKQALLKQKVRKKNQSHSLWDPLFLAIERALGFSEKDCLVVRRIFLDLFLGQLHQFNESLLFGNLLSKASSLGVRLEKAGSDPVCIRNESGRRFLDLKTNERFGRFLDLSSSVSPVQSKRLVGEIPCSSYPDLWPANLLIHGENSSIFLEARQKSTDCLLANVHYYGSAESVCAQLSELFLQDFTKLIRSEDGEHPAPMILLSGDVPHFSQPGPYSFHEGNLFLLKDPSSLPFLGEEWVFSLYQAIPAIKKTMVP
jgi:hypothetical protein